MAVDGDDIPKIFPYNLCSAKSMKMINLCLWLSFLFSGNNCAAVVALMPGWLTPKSEILSSNPVIYW